MMKLALFILANSFGLFCVGLFFFLNLRKLLIKNKIKQGIILNRIKALQDQFSDLDKKIEEQQASIKSLKSGAAVGTASKDSIEYNYDRAKSLLKRGVPVDKTWLQNSNMTEEELQLLAPLEG